MDEKILTPEQQTYIDRLYEEYNLKAAHYLNGGGLVEPIILPGDCVRVFSDGSVEVVEAIAYTDDNKPMYCLSNRTWVREYDIARFKAQGDERRALLDKLNEIDNGR